MLTNKLKTGYPCNTYTLADVFLIIIAFMHKNILPEKTECHF